MPYNGRPAQWAVSDPNESTHLREVDRDRQRITDEQAEQERIMRENLAERTQISQDRMAEFTELLAAEEERKFNQAIPELANTAQNQGFLETSGFGNALANERAGLAGQTAFTLAGQALADRNMELEGIQGIGNNALGLRTSGLERTFSQGDQFNSEQLARELGQLGVAAPAQASSSSPNMLGGAVTGAAAGSAFGPYGAVGGAAVGAYATTK